MNVRERVLEGLRAEKGVVSAELMDDEISYEVDCSERNIKTQAGMEFRNEGYLEAMKRNVRICMFCTGDLEIPRTPSVFYMTEDGTVMGHEVMPHEMEEYLARDDLVWVSDDFVMYPNRKGNGAELFVCRGRRFPLIDSYPGCGNSIMAVPAGPSDILLKSWFGVENRREIASVVAAFDLI